MKLFVDLEMVRGAIDAPSRGHDLKPGGSDK